jgi:hypothetical protein
VSAVLIFVGVCCYGCVVVGAWMLAGLVSLKAAVNIALGPLFGLSK